MEIHGHQIAFQWPSKNRIPWILLSAALMFVSAYSLFAWMGAVGRISGWTGLTSYEAQIPRLQVQAELWLGLAFASPFAAAMLLGFGTRPLRVSTSRDVSATFQAESQTEQLNPPVVRYLGRLLISVLGTVGFILCLYLIGLLLSKAGIQ